MMQLGDVIARFEDEVFVSETLFALDDLALTARITALAAENNVSVGEIASQAVGQFVNGASDEEWLTLVGLISRADNPGEVFLRRVLSQALPLSQECECG
jgi:hypothetical protein